MSDQELRDRRIQQELEHIQEEESVKKLLFERNPAALQPSLDWIKSITGELRTDDEIEREAIERVDRKEREDERRARDRAKAEESFRRDEDPEHGSQQFILWSETQSVLGAIFDLFGLTRTERSSGATRLSVRERLAELDEDKERSAETRDQTRGAERIRQRKRD